MRSLRRRMSSFLLGITILAAAAAPTPAAAAAACPLAPGIYLLYDGGEIVGAMVVYSDCSAKIYPA